MDKPCPECRFYGHCREHPALDEMDLLDLLIPAPRRSPENVPVP
ncbi:hypothetical protein [Actinophytocola sp.]